MNFELLVLLLFVYTALQATQIMNIILTIICTFITKYLKAASDMPTKK